MKLLRNISCKSLIFLNLSLFSLFVACTGGDSPVTVGNATIQGSAQKGPFNEGSIVVIKELDSDLIESGPRHMSSVDNKGQYLVPVDLESPYIEIEVTGYYFNEVSETTSETELTLRALADVDADQVNTVNVNVLTTLTAPRIRSLVREHGFSFRAAKSRAEREVFWLFNIFDLTPYGFETMDITSNSASDKFALAISLLFQGHQSTSQMNGLIDRVSRALDQAPIMEQKELLDQIVHRVFDEDGFVFTYAWNVLLDSNRDDLLLLIENGLRLDFNGAIRALEAEYARREERIQTTGIDDYFNQFLPFFFYEGRTEDGSPIIASSKSVTATSLVCSGDTFSDDDMIYRISDGDKWACAEGLSEIDHRIEFDLVKIEDLKNYSEKLEFFFFKGLLFDLDITEDPYRPYLPTYLYAVSGSLDPQSIAEATDDNIRFFLDFLVYDRYITVLLNHKWSRETDEESQGLQLFRFIQGFNMVAPEKNLDSGLVVHLPFDEGVTDVSNYGYSTTPNVEGVTYVEGAVGKAIHLPGGEHSSANDQGNIEAQIGEEVFDEAWSISVWVKLEAGCLSNQNCQRSLYHPPNNTTGLRITSEGAIHFRHGDYDLTCSSCLDDNTWHLITVVVSSWYSEPDSVNLYVDGIWRAEQFWSINPADDEHDHYWHDFLEYYLTAQRPHVIGGWGGNQEHIVGIVDQNNQAEIGLDDFRLYDRALNLFEVKELASSRVN